MRQVFFHIPPELWGIPVFGFGWLLLIIVLASAAWLVYLVRQQGWNRDTWAHLPMMLLAAALPFLLPLLQEVGADGEPLGLPIRGYGVMLVLGMVAGVGLSMYSAEREGIRGDLILSLAIVVIVSGIVGARVFFVIQYWETFQRPTLAATLAEMLKFTEGGLVVYGSVIGGLLAAVVFVVRQGLSLLKVADLIAPGMALGLAIGRIGCLLNGCCWGGACDNPYLAIRFPQASPVYLDQMSEGSLLGLELTPDPVAPVRPTASGPWLVESVRAGSPAADRGVEPGQRVLYVEARPQAAWREAWRNDNRTDWQVRLTMADGRRLEWSWDQLPRQSGPVHPTQIYSALNAALLCLLTWAWYPFRRRDGEVFGVLLTLYPVSRFLLEQIRVDESGQWGTQLSISQWVSLALLVAASGYWVWVLTRPVRNRPSPPQDQPGGGAISWSDPS